MKSAVHMIAGRTTIAADALITVGDKSLKCRVYADDDLLADIVFGSDLAAHFGLAGELAMA
ncbi:hypothetical protein [Nitrospirillum viridazoti]|uniref:Uncharacterized protein n=1 Tax=Nitrospirillum amazonense TaxID=28077 RepID=A0A560ITS6_9PROT|nr:hypothetical protein [Nitrospirillum amazonense]TWB62247.1 hypothetical protein FBZ92_105182 [Nitrospirillum amazonense]